jgi:hypothetical protein
LDNRIGRPNPPAVNAATTKTSKESGGPAPMINFLTGARLPAPASESLSQIGQTLSSALAPAASAVQSSLPSLPPVTGVSKPTGDFFEGMDSQTARGIRQQQAQDVERRTMVTQADEQTRSGQRFNVHSDVTLVYTSGKSTRGTDERALRELLWDRTPGQLEAIAKTYSDHYPGRDMWNDLQNEFEDPNDKKILASLKKGDRVGAASAAIVDATTGPHQSAERSREVLARLDKEELAELRERFPQDHPKGADLDRTLDPPASRTQRAHQVDHEMKALLAGDKEGAQVARVKRSLLNNQDDELIRELRTLNPDQREQFLNKIDEGTLKGQDIRSRVGRGLKGARRDEALALLDGNTAAADAALIHRGLKGNKEDLWDGLTSEIPDDEERRRYMQQVETEFDKTYGPKSEKGGRSLSQSIDRLGYAEYRDKGKTLLENGKLPPEKELEYAMTGNDTDATVVAGMVERFGPERAREMYAQTTASDRHPDGRDLDKDARQRFGGRDRFDVRMALKGKPESFEEMVSRSKQRAEFEDPLPKPKGFLRRAVDATPVGNALNVKDGLQELSGAFTSTDSDMWKNVGRAEEALEHLKRARQANDPEQVGLWEARVAELTGYNRADVQIYRGEKDGAVEGVALAATTGVAVVGTIASGGTLSPVAGAMLVGAGAGTNVAVKSAMQGDGYDHNDVGSDALEGGATVAATLTGVKSGQVGRGFVQKGAESTLRQRATGATVEGLTDGFVGAASESAFSTLTEDGFGDLSTGEQLSRLGTNIGVDGTVGAAMGGALGRPVEKGAEFVQSRWPKKTPSGSLQSKGSSPTPGLATGTARRPQSLPEIIPAGDNNIQYDGARVAAGLESVLDEKAPGLKADVAQDAKAREARLAELDRQVQGTDDPDALEKLKMERLEALKPSKNETTANGLYASAVKEEARVAIDRAVQAGRLEVGNDTFQRLLERDVALGIYKDATRTQVIDANAYPGLSKRLSPYDVQTHEGFDEVRKFDQREAKRSGSVAKFENVPNFDAGSGTQLVPNKAKETTYLGEFMQSNRALESQPARLKTSAGEVLLYNAGPRDAQQAAEAMGRVQEMAPNMVGDVEEIHFAKLVNNQHYRYELNNPKGLNPANNFSDTQGYVKTNSEAGSMVIRKGRSGGTDSSYGKQITDKQTRAIIEEAAEKGLTENLDVGRLRGAIVKDGVQALPEAATPLNSKAHTIAHEGAHAFDKRLGWKSTTGEWGPFGSGSSYSTTDSTDFVSNYSRAHSDPKVKAQEDFAETVALITQFPYLNEKPPLGPLSDSLVQKLEGAGRAVGAPPEAIQDIVSHYGRQ